MTEDELVGSRVRMEALFVSWGVNEPSLAPHQSFSYVRVLLAPIYVVGANSMKKALWQNTMYLNEENARKCAVLLVSRSVVS